VCVNDALSSEELEYGHSWVSMSCHNEVADNVFTVADMVNIKQVRLNDAAERQISAEPQGRASRPVGH
jgi:hypothetical protein